MNLPPPSISLCLLLIFIFFVHPSSGLVRLRGKSFDFTLVDAPARFAVPVEGSGICGSLHLAKPIDACVPLSKNNGSVSDGDSSRFVLIERGVCDFETKVRNAQIAGFTAAIIYDDEEKNTLYSMMGDPTGIHIHAVFVSNKAGETLKTFSQGEDGECCIGSPMDGTVGAVLVFSFVSLVVIISVLAVFFFARNCGLLRHAANHTRPSTMNRQAVELLPCFIFKSDRISNKISSDTCAICLEDYKDGDTLRALPCLHEFHLVCVDSWLTKWGSFCPVCKHDLKSR